MVGVNAGAGECYTAGHAKHSDTICVHIITARSTLEPGLLSVLRGWWIMLLLLATLVVMPLADCPGAALRARSAGLIFLRCRQHKA